jgi:hypothetical protein
MLKYLRKPLDDCFERVSRAGEHLADLEREIRDSIHAQIDDFIIEHEVNPLRFPFPYLVKARRGNETHFGMRIPILIGEIAYNLKSALDYLVYKLARLDSGSEQEGTQFPIVSAQKDWPSNVRRRLKGLNDPHIARIEGLQPYNGIDWTGRLRDINNPDKHRHLTVTQGDYVFDVHSSLNRDLSEIVSGYERSAPHPTGNHHPVKVKVYFKGEVTFRKGPPVIDTIKQLKLSVAQTLRDFEPDF